MLSGWSRAFVLIAAALLLAGVPCYGNCEVAASKSPQAPSNGCHHHKSSPEDQGCPFRHSEFAGPEPAVAGVNVTRTVSGVVVAAAAPRSAIEPVFPFEAANGSPPGKQVCSTISILRI